MSALHSFGTVLRKQMSGDCLMALGVTTDEGAEGTCEVMLLISVSGTGYSMRELREEPVRRIYSTAFAGDWIGDTWEVLDAPHS